MTDDLEIYIIELDKASSSKSNNDLDKWLNFINNPKENDDMESKELQKARKVLEEISQDEHERYLAELREKYIRDQHAIEAAGYDNGLEVGLKQGIEQGIVQGIEQGIVQGIEQGIVQGSYQAKIDIAKKLLSDGMDVKKISEITELSKEQIEELIKEQ